MINVARISFRVIPPTMHTKIAAKIVAMTLNSPKQEVVPVLILPSLVGLAYIAIVCACTPTSRSPNDNCMPALYDRKPNITASG